ncbi:MAG: LysR substrate-binding domain-containing protein [Woeseiaceae bacterium]|nr:LysR substrate-binding domain-containing protein [Woeseiaceae bacterium]
MDRLFCMKVFVRVVEHGAFVRAADDLGVSRATVTEAVAQLEQHLGVRLINRTTRRLSVTEEGQTHYANCVRLLDDIEEAEEALSGSRLHPHGRLRVSVPQSFINSVFYPGLARFMQLYPDLEVEIVFTDRAVNLVEEGVDCAIRGVEIPADSGLVAVELTPTRWLTCASAAYLAAHGTPRVVDDLARHNCIRFISPSTGRARDWLFIEGGLPVSIEPAGNLRLTSFDAAVQVALSGAGIAQVPDGLACGYVLDGRLQPLLTDSVAIAPSLVLVYPGNRYLTAKVRAFKEFFVREFPKDGWWPEIIRHQSMLQSAAPVKKRARTPRLSEVV